MYKVITIILLTFLATSCQMNKLHVYKNHKLYEEQLNKSLDSKKLEDAKYILEHEPNIKTLDYYKYVVKYHFIIDKLNDLEKVNKKETNLFVKNYTLALIYTARGVYYFDEGLKSFYDALKYKDLYKESISELYYNIAVIEVKKENYKDAIKYIELAQKDDNREKYIVLKSYILLKEGKFVETQKLLNDSFDRIRKPKNLLKALNIINIAFDSIKPMPKALKQAYARWLSVVQSGKNLQTVLTIAKEGMYEYPDYSEMYTLAGLASYLLDNKAEAVSYFDKAILINNNIPFNYIQMGVIYWNLKQYDKAEVYFQRAISMNKYLPIVYAYLSKLKKQSGSIHEAIKYQEYQLKFVSNIDAEMDLVKLYKEVKKTQEIKELLERVIAKFPNKKAPYKEMVGLYDRIIDEEVNPDVKVLLRKKQLYYEKLYEEKDEEESKRRLVTAELEGNDKTKK